MGIGGGLYNRIGRGIPDVAANGDNIATYVEGQFTLGAGTSASKYLQYLSDSFIASLRY